jgi:hypothetical protein
VSKFRLITGADIFINISTPKFAAQAIKKMAEIQWRPPNRHKPSRQARGGFLL